MFTRVDKKTILKAIDKEKFHKNDSTKALLKGLLDYLNNDLKDIDTLSVDHLLFLLRSTSRNANIKHENWYGIGVTKLDDSSSLFFSIVKACQKNSNNDFKYIDNSLSFDLLSTFQVLQKSPLFENNDLRKILTKNNEEILRLSKNIRRFNRADHTYFSPPVLSQKILTLLLDNPTNAEHFTDIIFLFSGHYVLNSENKINENEYLDSMAKHPHPKKLSIVLTLFKKANALNNSIVKDIFNTSYLPLTTVIDEKFVANINPRLLSPEDINHLFALSKTNPDELNNELNELAATSNEIHELYKAIDSHADNQENYNAFRSKYISKPLYIVTDLAKELFSWTLGFNWLIRLEKKLPLPRKNIGLPQFSFDDGSGNDGKFIWVSVIGYNVSPANFIFVGLNYIARNLGKLLGFTLMLPWIVPVALGAGLFYGIKNFTLQNKIKASIKNMVKDNRGAELISLVLKPDNHRIYWSYDDRLLGFAKYIVNQTNEDDIVLAFQKRLYEIILEKLDSGSSGSRLLNEVQYKAKRMSDALKDLTKSKTAEKKLQQAYETLKPIIDNLEKLQNLSSLYTVGMELLHDTPKGITPNLGAAFYFLSRVSVNDPNYTNAMIECASILLALKMPIEANKYFKLAGEKSTIASVLDVFAKTGKQVRLGKLLEESKKDVTTSKEEKASLAEASSSTLFGATEKTPLIKKPSKTKEKLDSKFISKL